MPQFLRIFLSYPVLSSAKSNFTGYSYCLFTVLSTAKSNFTGYSFCLFTVLSSAKSNFSGYFYCLFTVLSSAKSNFTGKHNAANYYQCMRIHALDNNVFYTNDIIDVFFKNKGVPETWEIPIFFTSYEHPNEFTGHWGKELKSNSIRINLCNPSAIHRPLPWLDDRQLGLFINF